jgi:phytoene dehydrogenase-like protein
MMHPVIYRDPATTAAELARHQRSDGDNWWRLVELWNTIKAPLLDTLFSPFPHCARRFSCYGSWAPRRRCGSLGC